jgi:cytochrome c
VQSDSSFFELLELFFQRAESKPEICHVLPSMNSLIRSVIALLACAVSVATLAQAVPAPPREWVSPPPGDARNGAVLYQQHCTACHAIDSNKIGPAHRGVVGRRVGSLPGYKYSVELASSRLRWTPQTLNKWLGDPEDLVNGQRMGFLIESEQERADLIAYLATLK